MNSIISEIKGKFPKANITQLESNMVEVNFAKAKDSVIIQVQEDGKFTVSYPALEVDRMRKIKQLEFRTGQNLLKEGVFWVLSQVEKYKQVMPEFR